MAEDRKILTLDTLLDPKVKNPYNQTADNVSAAHSDMDRREEKEAALETLKNNYFKDTKAFKAIVLRVDGDKSARRLRTNLGSTGEGVPEYIEVQARIPSLHSMIPKPKMVPPRPEDANKDKGIIEMHPTFLAKKQGDLSNIEVGDVVLVEFNKGPGDGVQSEGRIVKIYQKGKVILGEEGDANAESYQRVFVSDTEGLTMGDVLAAQAPERYGQSSEEPATRFNWDQLGTVIDSGALNAILEYIGQKEGGTDGYNAVNRGFGGDSPGGARRYITRSPKDLTQMTITEARSYQRAASNVAAGLNANLVNMEQNVPGGAPRGGPGFLAIGRFQFIPATLQEIIDKSRAPGGAIFNENAQKRCCAYLLLSNKKNLGNYLISKYDGVEHAGQDLALIWASIPLQYTFRNCSRGQSAYCGDEAGNRASSSTSVNDVISMLRTTRERMKSVLSDLGIEQEAEQEVEE